MSSSGWRSIAIVGLAAGLSAVLLAVGGTSVVMFRLVRWAQVTRPVPAPRVAAATESSPSQTPRAAAPLRAREVPKSRSEPLAKPPAAVLAPAVSGTDPSAVCELPLRLAAVMFDPEQPARSLAVLRGAAPGTSRVSAIGTRFGDHTLTHVSPRSARFDRAQDSCWLHMFGAYAHDKMEVERANASARAESGKKRRRRKPVAIQSYPPPRALSPAELARGIQRTEADSYVLDRQLMEKALERWDRVAATTRWSASKQRNQRGVRIRSLRDAGLLASLGLRSGDVLRTVNGRPIVRKRDLRRTIAALGGGERVNLGIERDKRAITFDYVAR